MQMYGGLTIVVLALATLTFLWPVFELIALTIYVVIRTLVSIISGIIFAPFIIVWRKVRALWARRVNCSSQNNHVPRRKHNRYSSDEDCHKTPRKNYRDAPEFAEDSDYGQECATVINDFSKQTSGRPSRKKCSY